MPIRLLALDLDETLLHYSRGVSPRNLAAVRAAARKGVHIIIATGRGPLAARSILQELDLGQPSIHYGGALVLARPICHCGLDPQSHQILRARYVPEALVKNVLRAANQLDLHAQIYEGDTVVFARENLFTERYTKILHLPCRLEPNLLDLPLANVPKVLVYSDPEWQEENRAKLAALLPADVDILTSSPGFLEIGAPGATKGAALAWLAEYLGVPQAQTVAIGDNTLDADMITWAGLGCCVGNANEAVKPLADLILPSCSEDGVACFIEEHIL